jgi:hypothetical protein
LVTRGFSADRVLRAAGRMNDGAVQVLTASERAGYEEELAPDVERNVKAIAAAEVGLGVLESQLRVYTCKPLEMRSAVEQAEVAWLSDEEKQLRDEKLKLHETEQFLLQMKKRHRPELGGGHLVARAPSSWWAKPFVWMYDVVTGNRAVDLVLLEHKLRELKRRMVEPGRVRLPRSSDDSPAVFCAEVGWLDRVTGLVLKGLASGDSGGARVAPLAFIRCSRGGKTRALEEVAKSLRTAAPNVAVLFVSFSFNDCSGARAWEHADPVRALCCRIAFAALFTDDDAAPTAAQYAQFADAWVTANDVESWLGDRPCLLLIDELNVLEMEDEKERGLAYFLKSIFLTTKGRFFVFTSHRLPPPGTGVTFFMDHALSERVLIVEMLPLCPSVVDAQEKLGWDVITVREALYRGRVPALIFCTRPGRTHDVAAKLRDSIAAVERTWDDVRAIALLRSFLSGDPDDVHELLWPHMNTGGAQDFLDFFEHADDFVQVWKVGEAECV